MQVEEVTARNIHGRPTLKSLIKRTAQALLFRIHRNNFRIKSPNKTTASSNLDLQNAQPALKPYEKPAARKLTLEQARLIVLGHSTLGDPGAQDLMPLLFPDDSAAS